MDAINFSRICDTFQRFVIRHRLLTERLIKPDFGTIKKFVRRHYALSSKYGVSVRTHVHEGTCIPLVARHELSKHITISRGSVNIFLIIHDYCIAAATCN